MRGTYLFAVAFLALATNALSKEIRPIPTKCPIRDVPEYTVHIAHKSDCTKFYKCRAGEPVEQDCPFADKSHTWRLHFNALEQVCDWPSKAGCENGGDDGSSSSIPDDGIITTTPDGGYDKNTTVPSPVDGVCPEDEGDLIINIPHECDCSLYYTCKKGEKLWRECPAGQFFDPLKGVCDYGECIVGSNECPANSKEKTYLSHECICNKYYVCQNGKQETRRCPAGEHFDIEREICDKPEFAGCDRPKPTPPPTTTTTPAPTTTTTTAPPPTKPPGICPDTGKHRYPYPGNCTLYYDCEDGEESVKACKGNLLFNPDLRVCDDPDKVDCIVGKEPFPTKCPPAGSAEKVFLPHQCECDVYYECDENGDEIRRECEPGKNFNPYKQKCDADYECPEPTTTTTTIAPTTTTTTTTTTPEPTTTTEDPECRLGDKSPHECDCHLYYLCQRGSNGNERVKLDCGKDYFDVVSKTCKPEDEAVCFKNNNFLGDDLEVEGCIGACPEIDPIDYVVQLPHKDCAKYCRCLNEEPRVFSCPNTLHYSAKFEMCTHQKQAECLRVNDGESSGAAEKSFMSKVPLFGKLFQ